MATVMAMRDLWADWADVFASVGNYLKVHGWRAGEPVMVPASIDGADLTGLSSASSNSTTRLRPLRARGIRFETNLPPDSPATLVALTVPFGMEYRVGFTNFNAITRYNRSHMYASAVNDLAQAVATTRAQASAVTASQPASERMAQPISQREPPAPQRHLRHRLLPRRRRPEFASPP